jgi:hypothetical protein
LILVVLEEHPLLTPEVEETKTDVELRALPEELSNSLGCAERQISPTSASVGNVADFFIYLHSVKKCKVATIIGYRSAISSKHKGLSQISIFHR